MGQKVNPVGFRLGTSRDHDSVWFAKSKDYSKLVLEDIKVRERVKEGAKEVCVKVPDLANTNPDVRKEVRVVRERVKEGAKEVCVKVPDLANTNQDVRKEGRVVRARKRRVKPEL